MVKITGVKFRNGGKVYYFDPGKGEYTKGQNVIVETANGLEFGSVVIPAKEVPDDEVVQPLKPVVRVATQRDEEQVAANDARRADAIASAKEKVAARGLEMKIVGCEFAFEGNKVTFYFTADGRVDFRELIKDLSALFRMRIELRQIGIRDEIKLMGGIAPCGRECCCASCMPDFNKVSIKMAKNQGLSLNPGKISGLCGRLMCCLSYENDYYAEACKNVPKLGSEVDTPEGKATVINVNMLKMQVKVKIEQGDAVTYRDFAVSDIKFRRGGKGGEEVQPVIADQGEEASAEELAALEDAPEKPEKAERADRRDRGERPDKGDRAERREKRGGDRPDRGERPDRGDRRDKRERQEGAPRRERGTQPEGGRERRDKRRGDRQPEGAPAQQPADRRDRRDRRDKFKGNRPKNGGQRPTEGENANPPKDSDGQ